MNILLTAEGIIGKDEFVTTARPNCYITVLRITPEQAPHFGGNERIGIESEIGETEAGCVEVYGVGDDNKVNGWRMSEFHAPGSDIPQEMLDVLYSLQDREFEAISAFLGAVTFEELDEMYTELDPQSQLMKLLAGMVNPE